MTTASRTPVIVGAGQISDHAKDEVPGPSVLDLMQAALDRAERDAGGSWLADADFLGIENQISSDVAPWPGDEAITPHLLARLDIHPRASLLTREPSGDGPIFLLNHAANLIASGEARIAAITGAEALRTAANRAALAAQKAAPDAQKPDAMRDLLDASVRPFLRKYGLMTPTDVYPLYESATRAAWGQTFAEAQAETARLWSAYSQAAAANPYAWSRAVHEPDAILEVTPRNRMIAYPYSKLMVANSAVNQGAALIVTSLEVARERGVPDERIVFVGAGAAAHEDEDFLARDSYAHSPAMIASIGRALEMNGLAARDLDCVELYSCFPCIPKMARRVLDWPLERLPSVYGGLTFGGGPIGNCMMHAAAAMAGTLRAGARHGLIFANGGFATHNHTIILSRTQPREPLFPQDFDVQADADRLRGPVPRLDEDHIGPGRIEALSVPFRRDGTPAFATIVGRAPQGSRFVARVPREDDATLRMLLSGVEPVGMAGDVFEAPDGYRHWRAA
ncbi:acetyl-CoA acetyltransferase [Sphingomonas colocasiae]|uniref:Acetyl-CoA acetyltransferase n=1 Tax=Sphingomonas colocasiae TaxID=1848973 RepID=A0ABS7PW85_9SPHN|nr:acetyl-CoA acetyltransferase [Sphingomonas colocasiae]MBY8825624.1 acetyl-CoA acetyltransferase [Sphingomonas colocasiae]